jgi:hypothetical protein
MEFQDTVLKRRMVRNFAPDPVDPAVIDRIVNLALHAPSAALSQGQPNSLDAEWPRIGCRFPRGVPGSVLVRVAGRGAVGDRIMTKDGAVQRAMIGICTKQPASSTFSLSFCGPFPPTGTVKSVPHRDAR